MRKRYDKYSEVEKKDFLWRELALLQVKAEAENTPESQSDQGYKKMVGIYHKLLEQHKEMSEGEIRQILYTLATIHLQGEVRSDHLKALDYFHEWLGMEPEVKPQDKFYIGSAHLLLRDLNLALDWIEEAIADTLAAGKIPRERWYDTQKYIYYEQKNHRKVAEILETLVEYYPKPKYWEQLGATYQQELERPIDGMIAFDALYIQDKMKKSSFLKALAFGYLTNDAPYKMAQIFEWGMKNGHLEATETNLKQLYYAWIRAKETEKAIDALERFNKKASDADMIVELANQYIRVEDYKKAIEIAKTAKKAKKKAKRPGAADFVAGIGYFYLKEYNESLKAFKKAAKDPKTKGRAEPWIGYVTDRIDELKSIADREKALRKALAEAS